MRCPHCTYCLAGWPLRFGPLSGVAWHPYPANYSGLRAGTVKCGPCQRCAAYALGAIGGAAGRGESKRRDVDYAALGRKGGLAKRKPSE